MASLPANGRPRRRLPRVAVAGALSVALCSGLLAGCGGPSKASGAGGPGTTSPPGAAAVALPADQPQKAACGLLTQAEVEAAVGAKVVPGKQENQQARSLCVFTVGTAADQSVAVVSTSSSGVPAAYTAARAKAEGPQSVSAGDEAFVSGAQALVRRGNTMVLVLIAVRQPAGQITAAATKLAQAVGARL